MVSYLKYGYQIINFSPAIAKTVLTLFSTRVKMSAYANSFIELAPVSVVTDLCLSWPKVLNLVTV